MSSSSVGLTRTLYRELLRTARRVERATRDHSTTLVAGSISQLKCSSCHTASFLSEHSKALTPTALVRGAFRLPSTPHDLDDAFTALRIGNETWSWLDVNDNLHRLHEEGASATDGACVIADALDAARQQHGCCQAHVADELDAIASSVRALLDASDDDTAAGRLRTVQRMNTILFDVLGYRGEYGDIEANSSIREALIRRRGLPITMCALYEGVASRLGLAVAVTNFPSHVLLRLEPETAAADGHDAADGNAAADGNPAAPSDVPILEPADLAGLFVAGYGPHGPEVVEVKLRARAAVAGGGHELVATKLTGDANVPAGQRSWAMALPVENAGPIAPGSVLPARVQVADTGFVNARDVPASLEVQSKCTMLLRMSPNGSDGSDGGDDGPIRFSRCDASDLWFVDAFAKGQLIPADVCRSVLSRAGLPTEEHAPRLASVPPARMWARMCRNLALFARREGREERAEYWDYVESGLDEVAGANDEPAVGR